MMTQRTLEERVDRLEDIEAIRKLVLQYGRGADRQNDPDIMRTLFEDECSWESPQFGRYEGLDNLLEAMSGSSRESIVWTLHFNVAIDVDLDTAGTSARCRWHLWEPMKMRQPGAEDAETWFGATYDTHCRKQGDGSWKIARLRMDAKLLAKVGDAWPGAIGEAPADAG